MATALLFVLTGGAVQAKDYYLGSNASQQGGTALASIEQLNGLALQPGDRVLFRGGETFNGSIDIAEDDGGSAAAPVVITSYGSGRARINAGTGDGIKIYNTAGFAVSDLDLVGSGRDSSTGIGLNARAYYPDDRKLTFLKFERMKISGFSTGVELFAWYSGSTVAFPGFKDVSLIGLEVFDNCRDGIVAKGTWTRDRSNKKYSHENLYIANCAIYNNKGDISPTSFSGSGINIASVDHSTIEYCVAHDNGGNGPTTGGGPYGIWTWESRDVKIQYNLVYNQKTSSGLDGGAYDLDGGSTDCVIQYNYSYNNEGPAIGIIQFSDASPLVNSVVRYNISENDCRKTTQGIVYIGEFSEPYGVNGADIYGNTFYVSTNLKGNKPPLVVIQAGDDIANIRFRNNLFVASHLGGIISGATTSRALFQGNNYWGGTFDLAAFRASGQEMLNGKPVGTRVDPQLANPGKGGAITDPTLLPTISAYTLRSTSPMIGAGLNLTALFGINPGATDYYGLTLSPATLNVGASSGTSSPVAVPPPSSTVVDDQFNGDGSLSGRIPDGAAPAGASWKMLAGKATTSGGNATTSESSRAVIDSGLANCTLETTIQLLTTDTGVLLRSSDGSNYLRLVLLSSSLQLKKTQAGGISTLATKSHTFVRGNTYKLRVVMSGSTITVYVDGTLLATFTTSFNQEATKHGLVTSNAGVRNWERFTISR